MAQGKGHVPAVAGEMALILRPFKGHVIKRKPKQGIGFSRQKPRTSHCQPGRLGLMRGVILTPNSSPFCCSSWMRLQGPWRRRWRWRACLASFLGLLSRVYSTVSSACMRHSAGRLKQVPWCAYRASIMLLLNCIAEGQTKARRLRNGSHLHPHSSPEGSGLPALYK